jgi:hypothetical protein
VARNANRNTEIRTFRLEEFSGLWGYRQNKENEAAGRMMDCRNVELMDGEWWTRPGYRANDANKFVNLASMPWMMTTDLEATASVIISNPFYALIYRPTVSSWVVYSAYLPSALESVTLENGSNLGTSTSTRVVGDLLLVEASGGTDEVYRVIAVSGTAITLDRQYEGVAAGPTVKTNCEFVEAITDPGAYIVGVTRVSNYEGVMKDMFSVATIDQTVTLAGNALWTGSPAVTDGDTYMIICSPAAEPAALNMSDPNQALITDFFRVTGTDPFPKILRGWTCCSWKNSLVIAHAGDSTGLFTSRSVWISRPGNFIRWHDDTESGNSQDRNNRFWDHTDDILAVETMGANLIVHRSRSQHVGTFVLGGAFPFRFVANNQGYGLFGARNVVRANNVQYLWTQAGPAVFDGNQVQPIGVELRHLLQAKNMWDRAPTFAYADRLRTRVVWVWSNRDGDFPDLVLDTSNTDDSMLGESEALVYDYTRDAFWIEKTPNQTGAGFSANRTYIISGLGTLLDPSLWVDEASGFDQTSDPDAVTGEAIAQSLVRVDASVSCDWFNLGSLRRKMLTRLYVELRTLETTANADPWEIADLSTDPTDEIHFADLDIFVDKNETAHETHPLVLTASTMLALSNAPGGQHPLMVFQVSTKAAGHEYRFALRNDGAGANVKGAFRLAGIEGEFTQYESSRLFKPINKT